MHMQCKTFLLINQLGEKKRAKSRFGDLKHLWDTKPVCISFYCTWVHLNLGVCRLSLNMFEWSVGTKHMYGIGIYG